MTVRPESNEGFRAENDFACLATRCRTEMADILLSILKASKDHKIKLMPNSSDGSTGRDLLNVALTVYFTASTRGAERTLLTDLGRLMAVLSATFTRCSQATRHLSQRMSVGFYFTSTR